MAAHYLDFERPIAELEAKIEELSKLSDQAGGGAFDAEIDALRDRATQMRAEAYANLDAWQKTQVARHPERPHFVDYIAGLIDDFVELRGDRKFADDQAIVGGLGRFRGTAGGGAWATRRATTPPPASSTTSASARPEGYRKAVRLMDMAEQFDLPVITFVDTAGAYPGIGAEERGQAEAIARSTERCLTLGEPMIATITGEGGSGGALAIAAANKVLMLEHAIYSVISPGGCASILLAATTTAPHAGQGDEDHRPGPDRLERSSTASSTSRSAAPTPIHRPRSPRSATRSSRSCKASAACRPTACATSARRASTRSAASGWARPTRGFPQATPPG